MTVHFTGLIFLTHKYMIVHFTGLVHLTHKYMTVHFTDLVPLTHKYMTVHFTGLVPLSCNNVAPVTNVCLGRATTRSHSSQWSKKKIAVET